MKNLKRIIALLMTATMLCSLAACGKGSEGHKNNSETASGNSGSEIDNVEINSEEVVLANGEQILIDVYYNSAIEFQVMTWEVDVNDAELVKTYAGLDNGDKIAALAVSEPAMAEIAYSAVLVEVKDAKDVEEIAKAMKEGVDPKKWEDAEADDMDVIIEGKYICLVMISSEFKDIATAKGLTAICSDLIKGQNSNKNTEVSTESVADTEINSETGTNE